MKILLLLFLAGSGGQDPTKKRSDPSDLGINPSYKRRKYLCIYCKKKGRRQKGTMLNRDKNATETNQKIEIISRMIHR